MGSLISTLWTELSVLARPRIPVLQPSSASPPPRPTSVNYHFTRKCNYKCGFCFHTAKTSYVLPLQEAKRGLSDLKLAGMEKVNFSGGEPFIHDRGRYLGELVKFCKIDLELPSVTIISNGSLIKERWIKEYGKFVDIMAISCDSFNEETNYKIGRWQGSSKDHIHQLKQVKQWCDDYKILFKLNTVVNTYNVGEDMAQRILELNPVRWKVFQCLLLEGENTGESSLRDAREFLISDEEFDQFLERHKGVPSLVPESNEKMKDSYLILDEYMRFLNCQSGSKLPSASILDVGVEAAISDAGFDERMFKKRGGMYKWSKLDHNLDW